MNKKMIMLMAAALALLSASGQVVFNGVGDHHVIEVTPDITTGLDKIFVVYDTQGVSMSFNSSTGERATWESFNYSNGLVMEPISGIRWNGMATTLDNVMPNMGYKIQEGSNRPYYCWVVNYADYKMKLNGMSCNNEVCDLLSFNIDGKADAIPYYTIDGLRQVLDREIKLAYQTQVWDDDMKDWIEQDVEESFAALDQGVEIAPPPFVDTRFRLTGDRFLKEWEPLDTLEKAECDFETQAVDCRIFWEQEVRENLNGNEEDLVLEGEILGGSAPVHIVFTGRPTSAVVYRVWEIATDLDFQDVIQTFNQDVLDYTFDESGTYYVRYMVANASGTCEAYSEIKTVNVDVSYLPLQCPNVFSPNGDGINDIWKVKFKSLTDFHCWIFNRWGNLVYEYTDPSGGWDGTFRGKVVEPDVFYYVLTATGADGQPYRKRGAITVRIGHHGSSIPGTNEGAY